MIKDNFHTMDMSDVDHDSLTGCEGLTGQYDSMIWLLLCGIALFCNSKISHKVSLVIMIK